MTPDEMRWPSLSVVISAYNMERYLAPTLEAVFALDYPVTEVIVVDDGSTDRTAQLAGRYPVQLVRHERNRGPAAARNSGARAARGEALYFLDADFIVRPDTARRLMERLCSQEQLGAVAGRCLSDRRGRNLAQFVYDVAERTRDVQYTQPQAFPYVNCANTVMWRRVFEQSGGFDEAFRYLQDFEFTFRLSLAGRVNLFEPSAHATHNNHRTMLRRYFQHVYRGGQYGTRFRLMYRPAPPYSRLLVPNPMAFTLLAPVYYVLFLGKIVQENLLAGRWADLLAAFPMLLIGRAVYVAGCVRGCWDVARNRMPARASASTSATEEAHVPPAF